ncbi:MAG: hypothetical protein OHK0012_08780 [Synechococcales cyanobacterium]
MKQHTAGQPTLTVIPPYLQEHLEYRVGYTPDPWRTDLVITSRGPLSSSESLPTFPSHPSQTQSADPDLRHSWMRWLGTAPVPDAWRENVVVASAAVCLWWHRLEQHSAAAVGVSSLAPLPKGQTPNPAAVAITGIAALIGTVGVWLGQHSQVRIESVPASPTLLAEALQQNFAAKQEAAQALLATESLSTTPQGILRHTVTGNQTLWQLTQMYQVDVAAITTPNQLTANSTLSNGQQLLIPAEPGLIYTVKSGDTLESIARRYQVPQREIIRATPLTSDQYLRVGQNLLIPGNVGSLLALQRPAPQSPAPSAPAPVQPRTHTIAAGDTLATIARRYGISVNQLQSANPGLDSRRLTIGRAVRIPGTAPSTQQPAVAVRPPQPAPPPSVHRVAPGDTLGSIASRYGLTVAQVQQLNPRVDSRRLRIGDPIVVNRRPAPTVAVAPPAPVVPPQRQTTHRIAPGETLAMVARRYGVSLDQVQRANPRVDSRRLRVGQPIVIPGVSAPTASRPAAVRPLVAAAPAPVAAPSAPRTIAPTPLPDWPEPEPVTAFAPPPAASPPSSSTSFIWPIAGRVTSGFGWRRGRMHAGVDIPGPVGTPIVAVANGTVIFAGYGRDGYGNRVDIRHPNGVVTRYAHGSRIFVSNGQQVTQGQTIMSRGSTGWSTGPHLHFEVRPGGGAAVNPLYYLP